MNASLARLSAIIILALFTTSHAEQTDKQSENAKLVSRIYRVPPSLFYLPGKGCVKIEKPKSAYKKLPPTSDGEARYDVWNFFQESGVKKVPGAEAIYLEDSYVLVVTGLPETHELVDRILGLGTDCGGFIQLIEIAANLWEYEDDPIADAAAGLHQFADIRQRAGDSLKLIDSQLIVTKTGQRAVAVSRQMDTAHPQVVPAEPKTEKAKQRDDESRFKLNGARGGHFEVEPTIGPDDVTVDMQFGYEARLKRSGAPQDAEINVTTNVTLMKNRDVIPYCALVQDDIPPAKVGKVRRRALVISVRLMGIDGLSLEDHQKQLAAKEDQLIRKARAGLGAPKK